MILNGLPGCLAISAMTNERRPGSVGKELFKGVRRRLLRKAGMYSSTSAAAGFPSAHQPVTRSRTLLFLSYRDSRAPISSSSASVYPPPRIDKGKGRAGQNGYAKASGGKGVGEEGERLLNGNEADEVRLEMDQANDGLPPRWWVVS